MIKIHTAISSSSMYVTDKVNDQKEDARCQDANYEFALTPEDALRFLRTLFSMTRSFKEPRLSRGFMENQFIRKEMTSLYIPIHKNSNTDSNEGIHR